MFFINLIRSDLSASEIVLCVVALLIAATLSIVAHEVSHGYVALWNGDPTAKMRNRLTFNPVVHFDVLGVLMLLLCGFGWAKPVPINPGRVGLYVCGPTVYGDAHLGHARPGVTYDVLVKFLKHLGYKVRYVRNITDVGHLLGSASIDGRYSISASTNS